MEETKHEEEDWGATEDAGEDQGMDDWGDGDGQWSTHGEISFFDFSVRFGVAE